ncbi:hypothetical protein [Sphingomonas aerolata]|uniref:hypothetical protein n=1 Tax=Sphingomonas aerolata TaxID=185951 RepID=UPI002FE0991A
MTVRFDPLTALEAFVNLQYYPQGTRNRVRLSSKVTLPPGVTLVDGRKCFDRRTWIVAGKVCRARIQIDQAQRPVPLVVNADEASAQSFLPARVVLVNQRKLLDQQRLPNLERNAHRATYEPSHTARLTPEETKLGWRFIPSTAQAVLSRTFQNHWANNCWMTKNTATLMTFTYGFMIEGKSKKGDRARNGSVTCHVDASIAMTRDVWVPQKDEVPVEEALADQRTSAPTLVAALASLKGAGEVRLPQATLRDEQEAALATSMKSSASPPTPPENFDTVVSLWQVPIR